MFCPYLLSWSPRKREKRLSCAYLLATLPHQQHSTRLLSIIHKRAYNSKGTTEK